jgi:hypothetical protein
MTAKLLVVWSAKMMPKQSNAYCHHGVSEKVDESKYFKFERNSAKA